jgi:hypothetical protein
MTFSFRTTKASGSLKKLVTPIRSSLKSRSISGEFS